MTCLFSSCRTLLFSLLFFSAALYSAVEIGLDRLFTEPFVDNLRGKRVGLITNSSAMNCEGNWAFDLLDINQKKYGYSFVAAFAPEHGLNGEKHAGESIRDERMKSIPVYSLHGKTKRPTKESLKNLDVLVYDIQNVGTRCYTYETTLFYAMEEAAKEGVQVLVLDRPNPRGGDLVEGHIPDPQYRCFFNYAEVPFCPGMTIGELASFFNQEYKIGCDLKVVPLKGWKRDMHFMETGLSWTPPSPNIPRPETTLVYPATIVLGETLEIVSVDLRGEKPFQRFGAPWIVSEEVVTTLNQQGLPGVVFSSDCFKPKWGKYKGEMCDGISIKVVNARLFQPLLTQYTIIDCLRELYPDEFDHEFQKALKNDRAKACNYLTGTNEIIKALQSNNSVVKTMDGLETMQIKEFLKKREKYLLY